MLAVSSACAGRSPLDTGCAGAEALVHHWDGVGSTWHLFAGLVVPAFVQATPGTMGAGLEPARGSAWEFPSSSVGKESACSAGHLGQEDPLEKEMATHCSILAWRIPWTEEPGGHQSLGSQESDIT